MHKYLEKKNEVNFDKIFNQMLGESKFDFSFEILLFISVVL